MNIYCVDMNIVMAIQWWENAIRRDHQSKTAADPTPLVGSCSRVFPFFIFYFKIKKKKIRRKWEKEKGKCSVCFGCYPQWRSGSQACFFSFTSSLFYLSYAIFISYPAAYFEEIDSRVLKFGWFELEDKLGLKISIDCVQIVCRFMVMNYLVKFGCSIYKTQCRYSVRKN